MDYKEKYERALKVAQTFYNNSVAITKKGLEDIFPELIESEDEKIRKELIYYFKEEIPQCSIKEHADKMKDFIAWLEKQGQTFTKKDIDDAYLKGVCDAKHELAKQGEQDMIPLNKVIKFLDEQLVNDKDEVTGEPFINFKNYGAFKETFISFFKRKMLEKQCKQKSVVIPKFKVGDWIRYKTNPDDVKRVDCVSDNHYILDIKGKCNTVLFTCQDLWELVEQKPVWSEEDENMRGYLLDYLNGFSVSETAKHQMFDWLKSLRPQNHWKPSDEQFKLLKHIMENVPLSNRDKSEVGDLYLDLKRLK